MGTGQLWATAQCAKQDFAELLRQLGGEENATAAKIVLICDKLNTYGPNVLYERNVPPEACQLVERFEPHYAREHDRWLNMVEIEPSVLERQCLRRRNASNNLLIV